MQDGAGYGGQLFHLWGLFKLAVHFRLWPLRNLTTFTGTHEPVIDYWLSLSGMLNTMFIGQVDHCGVNVEFADF